MESASGDAKAKSNGAAAAESSASSTGGGGGHRSSSSSNHHHSGHHNSSSAAAVAHAQAQAQAQAAAALGLLDPSALFGTCFALFSRTVICLITLFHFSPFTIFWRSIAGQLQSNGCNARLRPSRSGRPVPFCPTFVQ